MSFDDLDQPQPAAAEVLIKVEAAGINYIDTYQRSGLYQTPLPATLGLEASGTVEGISSDVSRFKIGDRVAYTNILDAYAGYSAVDQNKVGRLTGRCFIQRRRGGHAAGLYRALPVTIHLPPLRRVTTA